MNGRMAGPTQGVQRSIDLAVVAVLTVVAVALSLAGIEHPARAVVAAPLVLILPGYALCAAALPIGWLGRVERLVYSLGMSLVLAALGAFVLNWTPWGVQTVSWALLLGATTLGASAIAFVRRWRHPSFPDAAGRTAAIRWPTSSGRAALWSGASLALAALAVAGALSVARLGAAQQYRAGFTQLWILPVGEAQQPAVRLGINSRESGEVTYRLQVEAAGHVLREWPSIALHPGEQWEAVVSLSLEQVGAGPITAALYRTDTPGTAYRHVTIWRTKESA
ncbi:MAG: DUF1616 domain-containing protein [Chloroflexota bacterium]